MLDLAVIILNYRTPDMTLACLGSLEAEVEPGVEVVVVDNASGDGSAERLERGIADRGWAWARLLRSPTNGGFAAGNNLGIRAAEAAAYLLLNSDTLVRPGALRSLRDALGKRPEAGVVGAGLLTGDGHPTYSHFRFHAPLSELVRAANTGPITRLLQRFDAVLPLTEQPADAEWVSFAAVLIRREVLQQVGLLDDGFFMYFEDVDYCRRTRSAGWGVLYWPEAKVVHLAGGSTAEMTPQGRLRRAPRYYYQARARYFGKYYGRVGLWAANGLWYLGRVVSAGRELFGRQPGHRVGEALDIWIHAGRPMRPPRE